MTAGGERVLKAFFYEDKLSMKLDLLMKKLSYKYDDLWMQDSTIYFSKFYLSDQII